MNEFLHGILKILAEVAVDMHFQEEARESAIKAPTLDGSIGIQQSIMEIKNG